MTSKPRTQKTTRKTRGTGQPIPLVVPLPGGGAAKFRKPGELTPRQTRELEVIGAELLPRIQQLANAQRVLVGGQLVAASEVLDGPPIGMSRAELRTFYEFMEACAYAYLESWTIERPLPDSPDAFQDLPRPLYDAVMEHASKLSMAGEVGFTVGSLPDDPEAEADPDLPTSPSGA